MEKKNVMIMSVYYVLILMCVRERQTQLCTEISNEEKKRETGMGKNKEVEISTDTLKKRQGETGIRNDEQKEKHISHSHSLSQPFQPQHRNQQTSGGRGGQNTKPLPLQ